MLNADTREFQFTSEFDGLDISAVIAVPSGSINGVVQIVHGMNEYKERYFPFMDYLASEGFISVIHDNRGHGKSICNPEDLGFMYRNGGQGFVEDIAQLTRIIRSNYPTYPCFLIGHSMGSLGARCFLRDHDAEINGLIILGCPCYSRFSGFARSIDSAVVKKLGSRFRSEKIYDIAEKALNKPFSKNGEAPPHSWICSDSEVVERFNSDPLCNFKYTLNGYEGLLWLMRETYSAKGWKVANPRLPIRFISGRDDPCMLSEKKFFKAMDVLENAGYTSISHRFFDGMRHEVLNEKNNMNVYKDIAKSLYSWIDRIQELPVEIQLPDAQSAVSSDNADSSAAPAQTAAPTAAPTPVPAAFTAPELEPEKDNSAVIDVLSTVPAAEPVPDEPAEETPAESPAEQVKNAAAEILGVIEAAENAPLRVEKPSSVEEVLESVQSPAPDAAESAPEPPKPAGPDVISPDMLFDVLENVNADGVVEPPKPPVKNEPILVSEDIFDVLEAVQPDGTHDATRN